jgi:hypothetical protein
MRQTLNSLVLIISLLVSNTSFSQENKLFRKKADKIISGLKLKNDYPIGAKDTLIDLNGDQNKDILIEFYYSAGTGLKNGVQVFLYDKSKKQFRECEQLNHLANPTFYFNKKIVTGYYIAVGGGNATKLKWSGLSLDTLEFIEVETILKPTLRFKINSKNYVTKKMTSKTAEVVNLPKEYNYFNYKPIIKKNSS